MRLFYLSIISVFICGAVGAQSAGQLSDQPAGIPPDGGPLLELDLPSAISLALGANREIQSAYLGRVSEEYALRVAEDRFRPNMEIVADNEAGRSGDSSNRIETDTFTLGTQLSLLVPTGGAVSFSSTNRRDALSGSPTGYQSGLDISFVQPLLRGGGIAVNRAPVTVARINERANILALKATINATITNVVTAYRALLLEQRQLDIAERSLLRARTLLTTNRAMIDAGRMAPQDIVQTEADVSQRELDLVSAENSVDSARLALIDILDIGAETQLALTDPLRLEDAGDLNFEIAYAQALNNRPSYLQALLQSEIARINVRTAKNERLWQLDAVVIASINGSSDTSYDAAFGNLRDDPVEYSAGLQLTVPFGDLDRKQGLIDARVALRRQELSLLEIRETVRIDIKDRVRTIKSLRKQVDLAARAAELAARQLDVENLKLSQGRSSNFQVLNLEDQLISAQINKATAEVSYLNALTELDEALGTTMETWRIPFAVRRYDPDTLLAGDAAREVRR